MKTLTTLERELSQIRKERKQGKYEDGFFGFKACKKSIKWNEEHLHQSLAQQYSQLISRGIYELGFNTFMIVACEELMEESYYEI